MEERELSLGALLPKVMEEVGYIQKQGKVEIGGGRGYKFASLEQVLEKVNKALADRGIYASASTNDSTIQVVEGIDGKGNPKSTIHAVSKVSLTFARLRADGTTEYAGPYEGTGSGADTGDKAVMKANSSAMKYALQKAFLISWGDDPEADPSLYEDEKPKKGKPAATKASTPAKAAETKEEVKSPGAPAVDDLLNRIRGSKSQNEHELLKPEVSKLRITDKSPNRDTYKMVAALWESEGKARGFIPAQA